MAYSTARGNTISCKNLRVSWLRLVLLMARIIGLVMLCRLSEAVVWQVNVSFRAVDHQEHRTVGVTVHSGIFVWACSRHTYELCGIFLTTDTTEILVCFGTLAYRFVGDAVDAVDLGLGFHGCSFLAPRCSEKKLASFVRACKLSAVTLQKSFCTYSSLCDSVKIL